MSSAPVGPPRHDAPFDRGEAEWMIQEMNWIPSDFPNTGMTALMRTRFNEAVAAYSLQPLVNDTMQRRCAAPVLPPDAQDAADVGVDFRVNLIEAEHDRVDVASQSSTELVDSDLEGQDAVVEVVDGAPDCEFFYLFPADPPSPDRCAGDTRRGPPSPDPAEQPDNKRRRVDQPTVAAVAGVVSGTASRPLPPSLSTD